MILSCKFFGWWPKAGRVLVYRHGRKHEADLVIDRLLVYDQDDERGDDLLPQHSHVQRPVREDASVLGHAQEGDLRTAHDQ